MMKKKLLYVVIVASMLFSCSSGDHKYDKRAISAYDKMSETIGKLESCSYTLDTYVVRKNGEQYSNVNDVYMRGPDKMYIHSIGTKGEKSYWYDGQQFAYYFYEEDVFDTLPAPDNIIKTIDAIHEKYGVDFPAADFFYPTFTDDMMDNFNEILFYGDETVEGVECIATVASNENYLVQIWIDKSTNLPHKLIINNLVDIQGYYEAIFSNWRLNPHLPDILFEFAPPEGAKKIELKSKDE